MQRKIGVLVGSPKGSVHLHRMIESLREQADVTVLLDTRKRDIPGWLFRLSRWREAFVMQLFFRSIKDYFKRTNLGAISIDNGVTFDLIVDTIPAPLIDSLPAPKATDGILDIVYGDSESGRSGPPGFWECHSGSGATGLFGYLNDVCVFSARYKSKRLSTLNAVSIVREGMSDLGQVLNRYAKNGSLKPLVAPSLSWEKPEFGHFLSYVGSFFKRECKEAFRSLRGLKQRFAVATFSGSWNEASASTANLIPNLKDAYFADPFIVERDDQTICFVEEYSYLDHKGRISAIDISNVDMSGGQSTYLGRVIEEDFHMSFPFPFEHDGQLYMIPEMSESAEIPLYQCTEFPVGWTRVGTLMKNVEAADSMVFKSGDTWWMATNIRPEGCEDIFSRLYLFHSDSPTSSNWTPHAQNPVLIDSDGGRNAGLIKDEDGVLYRVGQHQGISTYGSSCSVFRIEDLSPTSYRETKMRWSLPKLSEQQIGGHHVHCENGITAFDILLLERTSA